MTRHLLKLLLLTTMDTAFAQAKTQVASPAKRERSLNTEQVSPSSAVASDSNTASTPILEPAVASPKIKIPEQKVGDGYLKYTIPNPIAGFSFLGGYMLPEEDSLGRPIARLIADYRRDGWVIDNSASKTDSQEIIALGGGAFELRIVISAETSLGKVFVKNQKGETKEQNIEVFYSSEALKKWQIKRSRAASAPPVRGNKEYGFYVQPGLGVLSNQYEGQKNSSSIVGKIAAGAYYTNWEIRFLFRKGIKSLSTVIQATPLWLQSTAGYSWGYAPIYGFQPTITALAGMEFYSNSLTTDVPIGLLTKITNVSLGFQSRFTKGIHWDLGGTLLGSFLASQTKHIYVQGDLSYWTNSKLRLGAGYWADFYFYRGDSSVNESGAALELIVAYYF